MARPEAPVNRTIPARAKLADFLRERRGVAGLTYQQMADMKGDTSLSKTTFERAASGVAVPLWRTVKEYIRRTETKEEKFTGTIDIAIAQGRKLWIEARRAVRAPYYLYKAPDPTLISDRADLSRALRDQHVWAGCPSSGEMARMSGTGVLPKTTAYRIIQGRALPVAADQGVAFLSACGVPPLGSEMLGWLAAAVRVFAGSHQQSSWIEAQQNLQKEIGRSHEEVPKRVLKVAA